MARTSKTMLNNSGESGQPCLIPDLVRNALFCSLVLFLFCFVLFFRATPVVYGSIG